VDEGDSVQSASAPVETGRPGHQSPDRALEARIAAQDARLKGKPVGPRYGRAECFLSAAELERDQRLFAWARDERFRHGIEPATSLNSALERCRGFSKNEVEYHSGAKGPLRRSSRKS